MKANVLTPRRTDTFGAVLTNLVLLVPFTYMLLAYTFDVPLGNIHTGAGILCGLLLLLMLCRYRSRLTETLQVKWMLLSALVFFGLTIAGQLLSYQSILYYISGLRNNGRYFVFFFACILFLKAQWREWYRKVFDILFWINLVVTLYQYFVLEIDWDYLGGIFGTAAGCNAYTNVFFLIVITLSLLRYLNGQEKAWLCCAKCAAALLIAAMAELKMFVLEFAAILVLALVLTKFSRRNLIVALCGLAGVFLCIRLMVLIFPFWDGWFSIQNIWETATSSDGYTGSGDMNRLTAVPIAWNTYLQTWPQKLFGLGLGNCDAAPLPGMTAPFYGANWQTNYIMFSSGFIMLETGLVGLITYLGIFLTIFFAAWHLRRSGKRDSVYCLTTEILALMCFALFLYNCTLRTEVGFMLYFAMALAFVQESKEA